MKNTQAILQEENRDRSETGTSVFSLARHSSAGATAARLVSFKKVFWFLVLAPLGLLLSPANAQPMNVQADQTTGLLWRPSAFLTNATNLATLRSGILPTQTGQAGKYLQTDGSSLSWQTAATGIPTQITVADTTDTTVFLAFFESATGDLAPKTDLGATYNAATGVVTFTGIVGPLTGNVTGNVSGSSGSTTGNAATATALQTPRTINGTSFDGTANISINLNNALTAGTYLTSGGTFDGAAARTFAVDATSTNTVGKVVARDNTGNFAAGTITAALVGNVTGNADTATTATTATTANAGDSATAFFSAGQIERARGGTGADTSAYGLGLLGSDGSNNTIDVDTIGEVETAIGGTNIIVSTEIDTIAEVEALAAGVNIIVSTEIDTLAEIETLAAGVNIIAATEVDTSAELRGIVSDESGTGAMLFANGDIGAATGTSLSTTADTSHGSAGSTETFALSAGDTHTATLDANLTVTITGWAASGRYSSILLGLTQDGTGSRTVTWPAAVANTPTISATASSLTWVKLWTTDGGTTIYTASSAATEVVNAINNGATTTAPSEDAVFDALALKVATTAIDTSAELRGVLSDESGTGVAIFGGGAGGDLTLDASGFNGNLTTSDNTLQEVAQKLDDLTASGGGTKTYAVFTPLQNQPPASNFATLDTRNSIAVLDFDDSTEESAVFTGSMVEGASLGSGLIVRIKWTATSATSGDARWGCQIMALNATTDIDSDSYDTAAEVTTAAPATSGYTATTEITITTIDSLAAGESYRLKLYRDTTGADTITGDLEIHSVEVRSAL